MSVVLLMDFNSGPADFEKDHSGFGNDGTIYGAVRVPGPICQALSFDGSVNDYVNCGVNLPLTEWSFLFWMYLIEAPSGNRTLLSRGETFVEQEYYFEMGATRKFWAGFIDTLGSGHEVDSVLPIPIGEWCFITATFDGQYIRLYLNGVLNRTSDDFSAYTPEAESGRQTKIGKGVFFPAPPKAIIDEVRIYNFALSAEEINRHFTSKKREYGL